MSRENTDSANIRPKNGFSGGLHYKIRGLQWNFSSDNYISSHYYSGFRRGQTLFDQYLSHQSKRLHMYAHYQLVNSTPEYLNNYYYSYSPITKTSTYEAGIGTAFGKFNINLHPYYYTQGLRENFDTVLLNIRSTAWHGAMDLSYNMRSNMFMVSLDAGKVKSNNPYLLNGHYNTWTARFNYNYKAVGFSANIQYNPLYIIQETSPWQKGGFRQYSLGPTLHLAGLKGKLDFTASDYLNYYSYSEGWNNAFQSQVSYSWAATWSATATVMYNAYGLGTQSRFIQTRVSITKSFIQANAPGFEKLSLQFFGDENANGVWDANEKPVSDVITEINRSLAQSNSKGKLSYTNLKAGNYDIHIQSGNGWYILKPVSIFLKKNRSIKIGLIKSVTIQGKIVAQTNAYLQNTPNLEGIEITALDNAGNKYTTLSDAGGNFQMELPLKEFTFSVETTGHSFSVSNQQQKAILRQSGNENIQFFLTDQSRKVDVKQF